MTPICCATRFQDLKASVQTIRGRDPPGQHVLRAHPGSRSGRPAGPPAASIAASRRQRYRADARRSRTARGARRSCRLRRMDGRYPRANSVDNRRSFDPIVDAPCASVSSGAQLRRTPNDGSPRASRAVKSARSQLRKRCEASLPRRSVGMPPGRPNDTPVVASWSERCLRRIPVEIMTPCHARLRRFEICCSGAWRSLCSQ